MRNHRFLQLLLVLMLIPGLLVLGQKKPTRPPVKRAKPPKFDQQEVEAVFFSNVFEKVVGARPKDLSAPARAVAGAGNRTDGGGTKTATGANWSSIVSSTTIEDEVKALKLLVDKTVDKPGSFKGRGYLKARVHFSMLATLFAIVNEYDGDIRWKKNAKVARDLFARTAANCKSGSQQVYDQAKLRKAELGDLLQGSTIAGKAQDRENWENFIDRSPLMKRLEQAQQGRVQPSLSNKAEFVKNEDLIRHEAELIAAMAQALMKEGMEDAGDDTYDGYARQMEKGARDIVDAVKLKNHEQAQKALGEISKSCSGCHEDYRG